MMIRLNGLRLVRVCLGALLICAFVGWRMAYLEQLRAECDKNIGTGTPQVRNEAAKAPESSEAGNAIPAENSGTSAQDAAAGDTAGAEKHEDDSETERTVKEGKEKIARIAAVMEGEMDKAREKGEYHVTTAVLLAEECYTLGKKDKAIALIDESIRMIQTGELKVPEYQGVSLAIPAIREAAIADLQQEREGYILRSRGEPVPWEQPDKSVSKAPKALEFVAKDPDSEAKWNRALQEYDHEKYADAEAGFLAVGDRESAARATWSRVRGEQGAEAAFDAVLGKYPDTQEALMIMQKKGRFYKDKGDAAKVRAVREEIIARYPRTRVAEEALTLLAGDCMEAGEDVKAEEYLKRLYELDCSVKGVNGVAVCMLSQIYRRQGRMEELKMLIEDAAGKLESGEYRSELDERGHRRWIRAVAAQNLRELLIEPAQEIWWACMHL